MMETPFYHDDALNVAFGQNAYNNNNNTANSSRSNAAAASASASIMKKNLSLNLTVSPSNLKPHLREHEGTLTSPDLGFLKLTSPDLERLIIQSSGMVTTSPTPGQNLFPKGVTDEQNSFAEGFVKALEDLHKQNQLNGIICPQTVTGGITTASSGNIHQDPPIYTNLNTFNHGSINTTVNYATDTVSYPPLAHPLGQQSRLQALKDEPQTVPDVSGLGDSPPLSPIDMDTQERIKAERKRLRNRIAASKCRKRKLERISRLEDKVKNLKSQNSELASTASLLREQVAQLKQKVMTHVNSGCQLLLTPQVQAY
ncbi:transcription factor jun-D [Callorhinchus milii]|uniref:JunD proto-onco, AP-1 transcription factor subunit n=1 Tax=Callorhinchus milii TaxID=7868 RepID=A0A4W3H918_CALMI|nr:transcription factor jun-D [Callorhinchus milii]|eukprot:gi/632962025/ref/XP_007897082.1/ PREDICTED: transcription factor jun-D [Callorhinchus milii]